MKVLKRALIVLVVVIAVIAFSKDVTLKFLIQRTLSSELGVATEIGHFHMGVLKPVIHIRDLVLYNPEGFEERRMAVVPEIYVHYAPVRLLTGDLYFHEVVFHLETFAVERGRDGKSNLSAIKAFREMAAPAPEVPREEEVEKKDMSFHVGVLHVKAEKVTYSDLSRPREAKRVFNVNIDERYENVEDISSLVQLIIASVMRRTVLPSLLGLPSRTFDRVIGIFGREGEGVQETIDGSREKVREMTESGRELLRDLRGTLEGAQ